MDTPKIYVGTYAKYNNGSIEGAWIDLDGHDKDSFYEACLELHEDEEDPELMFQDFENFPKSYYGESGCDDELWEWLELDENEREIVEAFIECFGTGNGIKSALEAYIGEFASDEDQAWEYLESTGMWSELTEWAKSYFDIEKFTRDSQNDVSSHEGKYFNRNW
jgi:antirestriction protein